MAVVDDRPRLRSDVELVSGFDGESLLHVAPDGRYVRLGSAAAELVPYFDGTRSVHDIALGVVGDRDISAQDVEVALQRLVESLARAGFLDGVPRASNPSLRSWFSRTPTKRFPLLSADSVARFIRPATALVDVLRPPAMIILIACLAVVISRASVGVLAVRYMTIRTTWVPFVSLALCLLATVAHEASHAVVCHVSEHPVRSLGLALWYYFIPIAYADRTDTYRVRSRVTRVAISVAGPASDMFWCAVASVCLLTGAVDASSVPGQVLGGCVYFFLVGLLGNLNPLVPSDGQQALETAFGLVNVRNRAIGYLLAKLPGRDSDATPMDVPRMARSAYLVYGAACCTYLIAVAGMMIWSAASVVSLMVSGR